MMQKTDFEFELVIGEDCSQDKTREICFEYQKKYPDKIRVLWWHENVSKFGGNDRRVTAHCRGEFIAFCEGDDYWIDPLKLQKQVDYIRETKAVMCVADSEWHYPDGRVVMSVYGGGSRILAMTDIMGHYFHTTTYLLSRLIYLDCQNKKFPEIPTWYDVIIVQCMASMGPICYIGDIVSVYNWTGRGVSGYGRGKKHFFLEVYQHAILMCWGPVETRQSIARKCFEFILSNILLSRTINGERISWNESPPPALRTGM